MNGPWDVVLDLPVGDADDDAGEPSGVLHATCVTLSDDVVTRIGGTP